MTPSAELVVTARALLEISFISTNTMCSLGQGCWAPVTLLEAVGLFMAQLPVALLVRSLKDAHGALWTLCLQRTPVPYLEIFLRFAVGTG